MAGLQKVTSVHIIDVKYKSKYKTLICTTNFVAQTNYITFKGVEVDKDADLSNLQSINEIIENGDVTERYFPWSSIVEIQIKRYVQ